jgi:hypothetical protein
MTTESQESGFLWLVDALYSTQPEAPLSAAEESLRPKKRGDCLDGPRPCPWVGCRHNLTLLVDQRGGVHINPRAFSFHNCALDLADEQAERSPEEVAALLGISEAEIRQIEHTYLEKMFQGLYYRELARRAAPNPRRRLSLHARTTQSNGRDHLPSRRAAVPPTTTPAPERLQGGEHRAGAARRLVTPSPNDLPKHRGHLPILLPEQQEGGARDQQAQVEPPAVTRLVEVGQRHPRGGQASAPGRALALTTKPKRGQASNLRNEEHP